MMCSHWSLQWRAMSTKHLWLSKWAWLNIIKTTKQSNCLLSKKRKKANFKLLLTSLTSEVKSKEGLLFCTTDITFNVVTKAQNCRAARSRESPSHALLCVIHTCCYWTKRQVLLMRTVSAKSKQLSSKSWRDELQLWLHIDWRLWRSATALLWLTTALWSRKVPSKNCKTRTDTSRVWPKAWKRRNDQI